MRTRDQEDDWKDVNENKIFANEIYNERKLSLITIKIHHKFY